jgi:hypothetical protein
VKRTLLRWVELAFSSGKVWRENISHTNSKLVCLDGENIGFTLGTTNPQFQSELLTVPILLVSG